MPSHGFFGRQVVATAISPDVNEVLEAFELASDISYAVLFASVLRAWLLAAYESFDGFVLVAAGFHVCLCL